MDTEVRLAVLEGDVKEIKIKVDEMHSAFLMGKGAQKFIFWLGSGALAILAFRPWEWFNKH